MNWAQMKEFIREDLQDTGATPRWPDTQLYTFWLDAVRDYSLWFPLVSDRVQPTGTGTGPYALPSDFVSTIFVESPDGRFLEERTPRPGVRYPSQSGRPFYWYLQGGGLWVDVAPLGDDELLLTYAAVHATPDSVNDDASVITIPDMDLELPRLYVQAKVYGQMRAKQSSLDRFKTKVSSGNTREDNPLGPEVSSLMNEYYTKIAERLPGGVVRLHRPGRIR